MTKQLKEEATEPTVEDTATLNALKNEAENIDPTQLGSFRREEHGEFHAGLDVESLRELSSASDTDLDSSRELARAQRDLFGSETALQEDAETWESPHRPDAVPSVPQSTQSNTSNSSGLKNFFVGVIGYSSNDKRPERKPSEPRTLGESLSIWGRTLLKPVGEEKVLEDERWKLNLDLKKKSDNGNIDSTTSDDSP